MEVTRTNFQDVVAELEDILENATFLGIDGEFTGLNSGPDAGAFDTPAQYYAKLRSGSMDFLLVQLGLSVFTYDPQAHKYNQRSYNFYIFPRPLNRSAPDCRFMCQSSCMAFLANQGFDFNKLFKLGIPYLTSNEEEKLVKRLEERQKARDDASELIPISDDDRPQIEEICTRVDEFLSSEAEELTIDKCNAFVRRLVYQEIKMRWPNKLRVESKSDYFGYSIVVQRMGTKEEEEQKDTERRDKERLEMKNAVGMSILMRMIADSGKLIVGHNMLLDLCHIVHQFFGALPESYREFKSLVHSLFPRLLDTKIICQSQQFKESVPSSNLNLLLNTVSKSPFSIPTVEPIDGRCYTTAEEKTHEAGYDAYITGLCFIALSNYLGTLQKPEIPFVLSDSPLLNPFLNKLLIARLKDFPYINLVGNDPNPSRDHVFHLTFPKEWKHSDILQLFSPFGGVYVSWLSDTSAYVGLNRRDQASAVTKTLRKTSACSIQKYSEHQAALETNSVSGERKRKLSSSENLTTKAGNSTATNGVKSTQNDEGWEIATGNALKLLSESTNPSYSHEHPRDTPKSRGRNHEVVESLIEQIKGAQKVRLKTTLGLAADFRNGRKKVVSPKYMILGRDIDLEVKNKAEVRNLLRDVQLETSSAENCAENCAEVPEVSNNNCKATFLPIGKPEVVYSVKSSASCNEKLMKTNVCVPTKQKQIESPKVTLSPRRIVKPLPVSSSPSASPRSKRTSKKNIRNKLSDFNAEKQDKADSLSDQEKSFLISERLKNGVDSQPINDDQVVRKRVVDNVEEKVQLRKPSLKLLKSGRKRSENVLLSGNLIMRLAQIAGVILLLYFILEF